MTSPCLGPELSLDEGNRVQINLCGSPAQQDWPFPCSAKTNNGLHRDEDGCLWVTPQRTGAAGVFAAQLNCGGFCGFSSSAAVYSNTVVSLTITNPDTCRTRDYMVFTDYMWRFTPGSVATLTNMFRQVSGVDGGDAGWTLVHTVDSGTNNALRIQTSDVWTVKGLAPGASKTIRVGMRINATTGSGSLTSFTARIGGIGIASD
jgi:hypothetical protein